MNRSLEGKEEEKKTQYQPVPSSPLFFPFGFIDIILCPGNVSSAIEASKIPEIDRFPSI